ncbi:MAG TPA: YIP1 family protein [Thermoanaerobaculia bacterium]
MSPLFTVWTQPRQTADYVRTRSTLTAEVALAIASGLSWSIYLSHRGTALDKVESALALTIIAIGGVYLGLMRLFIGSGVLLVVARLLGGKATLRSGRIALGRCS